jgi:hypothetical protein
MINNFIELIAYNGPYILMGVAFLMGFLAIFSDRYTKHLESKKDK